VEFTGKEPFMKSCEERCRYFFKELVSEMPYEWVAGIGIGVNEVDKGPAMGIYRV
jgi:hypothetical protein